MNSLKERFDLIILDEPQLKRNKLIAEKSKDKTLITVKIKDNKNQKNYECVFAKTFYLPRLGYEKTTSNFYWENLSLFNAERKEIFQGVTRNEINFKIQKLLNKRKKE